MAEPEPVFDPSKPYKTLSGSFDPSKPFKRAEAEKLPPAEPAFGDELVRGAAAPATGVAQLLKETTGIGTPTAQAKGEGVKTEPKARVSTDDMSPGYLLGSMIGPAGAAGAAAKNAPRIITPMMRAVTAGGIGGMLQPTPEGQTGREFWETKKWQSGTGLALGFGLSVGGKVASKGVKAIGRYLARKNPEFMENEAVAAILNRIENGSKYGAPTAKDMMELMRAANEKGKPMTIMDFAERSLYSLGGRVMRTPGPGQDMGEMFLKMRDKGAPDRLARDVDKYVFSGPTMHMTTEALLRSREAAASPLYEQADALQGIWSPRLDEFFKNGDIAKGMARGYHIERNLALAENRPFNPTQMGVDLDAEGNIQIQRVPNMYVLDMAKKGLDAMIQGDRDASKFGRLSAMGRSWAALRDSYVKELESLDKSGVYKKARETWSGHSASLDAMSRGSHALDPSVKPEENIDFVKGLTEGDKEFARLGLADKVLEKLQRAGLNSDESRSLIRNEWSKKQMEPFFKSEKDFNEFIDSVEKEQMMHYSKSRLLTGSQSIEKLAEDVSAVNVGVRAMSAAKIAKAVVVDGNPLRAVGEMWRLYRDIGNKPDPRFTEEIAKILFSPDLANTDIGRRIAAGDVSFVNPAAGAARATQDVVAPALAGGAGAADTGGEVSRENPGKRSEAQPSETEGRFQTAAAGTPKVVYTDKPPKQNEPANLNNPMDPSLKEFMDRFGKRSESAPNDSYQIAEDDVIDPADPNFQIRLNQLLYDRNLSRKNGVDVNGPEYEPYNAKIRLMRSLLRG
jgi:hypothetical protein